MTRKLTSKKRKSLPGKSFREYVATGNEYLDWLFNVACAVRTIRRLGLRVSPAKSVAIWFYYWRHRDAPLPGLCLDINGEDIEGGFRWNSWVSLLIVNGCSVRTWSWSPKWRRQRTPYVACCRISVGPGSECFVYMRKLFIPESCMGLRCQHEIWWRVVAVCLCWGGYIGRSPLES